MSLKYAILGFLSVNPMSGYDLKKAFDGSVGHFWPADQAQIYRTLTGLVDDGLLEVNRIEQDHRPDRKEHRLTDQGMVELDGWLGFPYEPQPTREPFLLRVFFSGRLGHGPVREMLTRRIEEGTRQLAVLKGIASDIGQAVAGKPLDLKQQLRFATLDNGITHTQAEIDWATTLLDSIEEKAWS